LLKVVLDLRLIPRGGRAVQINAATPPNTSL